MWLLMGEGDGRARAREGVLIGNGLLAAFNQVQPKGRRWP
jgi:hypothetical protein